MGLHGGKVLARGLKRKAERGGGEGRQRVFGK